MPEEASKISEIKTTSDGTVQISVEMYNDLRERAARKAPIINQTTVIKTEEMIAKELRMWGGGLMGLGASLFGIGAVLYKAGRS